jgi:hypothetical protein
LLLQFLWGLVAAAAPQIGPELTPTVTSRNSFVYSVLLLWLRIAILSAVVNTNGDIFLVSLLFQWSSEILL